jgi:hypothetical protein
VRLASLPVRKTAFEIRLEASHEVVNQRAVEKVHALTGRSRTWQETTTLVGKVNRETSGAASRRAHPSRRRM